MVDSEGFLHRQRDGLSRYEQRTADLVWNAYLFLHENQYRSRAELEAQQVKDLRALLTHAAAEVPYYQRSFAAAGLDPRRIDSLVDLYRIPVLQRGEVMECFGELEARTLPRGMSATGEGITSGTTGMCIRVRRTNLVDLAWLSLFLRELRWSGIDPRAPRLVLRHKGPPPPGGMTPQWGRTVSSIIQTGPLYRLRVSSPLTDQWNLLHAARPASLLSYPSALDVLGQRGVDLGERPFGLRVIQSISETLEPEVQQRIEAAFGASVKNVYSSEEAGCIASICPEAGRMHVHAENVIVEVVDGQGRPCRPGETGRVLVTTLRNYRAPFIRYDIGDLATVDHGPCPCGRGLPTLAAVSGKVRPLLCLPDGRRKQPSGMVTQLGNDPGCRQFQLVQHSPTRVVLRVIPSRKWTEASSGRMRAILEAFFELPMSIEIELTSELPRTAGGKFLCVRNLVDQPTAGGAGEAPRVQ
jgi:phenylacetate-CoA ligase